ncbi:MAG TPA: GDP-L-fucose synthase [Candidatus Methylacidiphilales bacterium]|jgi:GDP-L-fucose synthase|nr:GDP-L-fucose synthase [Candidatus Methylacidiphilales bacterium]
MSPGDAIFVAGHRGMVGAALVRLLKARGFTNLLLRTRTELDLTDPAAVRAFYEKHKPAYVFVAAARVGGIMANATYPVEFLSENLQIELNLINGAYANKVAKLLFLGSSCIYPKLAPQPMTEECLLTGSLEPTNEPYALAKICGIKLCQAYAKQYGANFISAMPTNLYGPEDNFDLQTSHVLPALIHKFHLAKEQNKPAVTLWGTGSAYREFLHVDDLAEACFFLMENYDSPELVNVGCGEDITIRNLAMLVGRVVGFPGKIEWDTTKPDGTPRKLLDVSKLANLGWKARTPLEQGLRATYQWWLEHGRN